MIYRTHENDESNRMNSEQLTKKLYVFLKKILKNRILVGFFISEH